MLASAADLWATICRHARRWRTHVTADESRRVRVHLAALGLVAAAVAVRVATGADAVAPFALFHVAIAVAAAAWGFSTATVAVLGALLAARLLSGIGWPEALLFVAEAFVLAGVIVRLTGALADERCRMRATDGWLLEMKATERRGQLIDAALSSLEQATRDCAIIVLDSSGRVADWRAGATRLYGRDRTEVVGVSAAILFDDLAEPAWRELLSQARRGPVRHTRPQRHALGQPFAAELDITPISRGGFDGFALVVRDLRGQYARDAQRLSAAEAFARLQEEADTAQQQLATLQHVTDPILNSLESTELVTTLLERLRTSIDAEGIALVRLGHYRRRVFCASGGLQCVRGVAAPLSDLKVGDPHRILMIHNDAAGVTESSAAVWPVGVSSLMAVPVVRTGTRQAVMEVVNRTGRRATEWEMALVQVVAARLAGVLRDDPYADAGAVA